MQQPSDMAGNLACAAVRNASRTAGFMLDAQIELLRFRLKVAEAALEDVREMEHALSGMHDWSSLATVQSLFLKMQSTHSAMALQTGVDFMNKLQTAYLRQLTEWNEPMQRPQGQTASSQLFAASADSLRAFFDSFNVMRFPNSLAGGMAPTRSTDAKAEQAA